MADELTKLLISAKGNSEIIAVADLKTIWTPDRIKTLISNRLTETQIGNVRKHLLRTLSLLFYAAPSEAGSFARHLIEDPTISDKRLHDIQIHELARLRHTTGRQHFIDLRKIFTAIVLTEDNEEILEPGQVLPLIEKVEDLGEGMNGIVEAHIVARGHLVLKRVNMESAKVRVAKKTLNKKSADAEKELKIIRSLRDALLRTRGEIRLSIPVSIVTDGTQVHMLSLCAQLNLEKGLQKLNGVQGNTRNKENIMASIQQIKGLVGALEFLHNQEPEGQNTCYCHMDLKPENILVFDSTEKSHILGQWRITDFGISTVSRQKQRWTKGGPRGGEGPSRITYTVGTKATQIKGTYQPPEINKQKDDNMGRGSDIWSLGCVFAEVLAANLGMLNDLRDRMRLHANPPENSYYNSYYFYQKSSCPKGTVLNESFDKWLKTSLGKTNSSRADILSESEDIIRQMMPIKRIRRIKSGPLFRRLDNIRIP